MKTQKYTTKGVGVKDFLIKMLGGYKAVVVIVEKSRTGTKTVSKIVTFYPFVQMILATKLGIISFDKNMSVQFKDTNL